MIQKLASTIYYVTMFFILVYILVSFMLLTPLGAAISLFGGIAVLLIIGWILNKFLSEKGLMQLLLLLFLIFIQITLHSWIFTVLIFILLEIQLIGKYEIKRATTSFIFVTVPIVIIAISYFILFSYIGEKPNITENDTVKAAAIMEEDPNVLDVQISSNDKVTCSLTIDEPLSLDEQEELGENCARAIAEQIEPVEDDNDLGEIYKHYDLAMYVQLEEKNEFYQGIKAKGDKQIKWNLHSPNSK